eukprot:TRINITY_DN91023_c0_g1_i1.p1 TRINITY_DN91023_c0_g1~~TRINITY_DN91023_c0_g1_i1.p1  ORF type:complete len:173 (+),score=30.57 TRINITY_DN91023_c0_g1_i1:86-604(+)
MWTLRLQRKAVRALPQAKTTWHALSRRRELRVLAIGNTVIDTVLSIPQFPIDDKVWIDSKQQFVGGQGMNAAQNLALLGLPVSVVTRIGDDADGQMTLERFNQLGIITDHCIVVPGVVTMSASVIISSEAMTRSCLMHRDLALFDLDVSAHMDTVVDLVSTGAFDLVYTDGH